MSGDVADVNLQEANRKVLRYRRLTSEAKGFRCAAAKDIYSSCKNVKSECDGRRDGHLRYFL